MDSREKTRPVPIPGLPPVSSMVSQPSGGPENFSPVGGQGKMINLIRSTSRFRDIPHMVPIRQNKTETARAIREFMAGNGGRLAVSEGSRHTPDLYRYTDGFEPFDFRGYQLFLRNQKRDTISMRSGDLGRVTSDIITAKQNSFSDHNFSEQRRHTPLPQVQSTFSVGYPEREHSRQSESSRTDNVNPLIRYLQERTCYDLVPTSSKLVVFDTGLVVKKAFFALVSNGLRAAPLWSSQAQRFVGMLTITDFIMILVKFYKCSDANTKMQELEEYTIQAWRELMGKQYSSFVSIDAECSLYDGLQQLIKHKIHRLPILDFSTGNPLYILTHKRILKFLKVCIDSNSRSTNQMEGMLTWDKIKLFQVRLCDMDKKIGTFGNVFKMYEDQPLIEALELFAKKRVSALPVIQRGTDRLVNVYSKFDVINLAAERSYNQLSISVAQALEYRTRQGRAAKEMITCTLSDTIETIACKVVNAEVHRIVVVDDKYTVIGVVSLSDLLAYIVS